MTTPPQYITDLIGLIKNLSDKIDNLENKLDDISKQVQNTRNNNIDILRNKNILLPSFIPEISFQQWIQNFEIHKQDVMNILEINILDGFKTYLNKYIVETEYNIKPIFVSGGKSKQIFIYNLVDCTTNEAEWKIATDEDICVLVDIIWRKMIQYYFIDEEEALDREFTEDEQTMRDINKKILLDMKKKLISKHIKDITRFIAQKL